MMLYRFVDEQKAGGFPVERICDIAGVSRSAYYHWKLHRDGVSTVVELEERRLVKEIEEIWDDSDSTYGSPRVTRELRRQGRCVNHKRVERLMRIHDIVGHTPKKHVLLAWHVLTGDYEVEPSSNGGRKRAAKAHITAVVSGGECNTCR